MADPVSKVVHRVLSQCRHATKANVGQLVLDGDPQAYTLAASIDFVDEEDGEGQGDGLTLLFNAPAATPHVFITVTDGDPARIGRALAELERHERRGGALSTHDYVALDGDDYLAACDKSGAMLLASSDSYFLRGVSPVVAVGTEERRLLYVVLVNAVERDIIHAHGVDALFDEWDDAGRGITSVDDGLRLAR